MKTNLAKNTALLAIGSICTKGINIIMIPLFSAWLSTEDYGSFDLYCTYVTLLIPFLTLASSDAVFRFSVDTNSIEEKKTYISTGLGICLFLCSIFVITLLLVNFFVKWQYAIPFCLLLISELLNSHLQGFMRAIKKLNLYSLGNVVSTLCIALFVTIFVRLLDLKLEGIIIGYALGFFVGDIIMVVVSNYLHYISFQKIQKKAFVKLVKYSSPLIPNNICWWIINVSDRALLNVFIGPVANGIYALACKIPNMCASIASVFNVSWQETAVDVLKTTERDKYYNNILNVTISTMISVCAGILSFNYLLFEYLFDQRYQEAALYSPILVLSVVMSCVVLFFGGIQISFKNTKQNGITTMIGAVVNVLINVLLIPQIGIYAAAVSTVAAQFVITVLRYLQIRKEVRFEIYKSTLLFIVYFVYMFCSCYCVENFIFLMVNIALAGIMFFVINKGFLEKITKKAKLKK